MPRHATSTSFKPGNVRSPESIEKQRQNILAQFAQGLRVSPTRPGPNPKKGNPGSKNGKWVPVGTRSLQKNGYIKIKIAEPNVWLYEHRLVMSQRLGRALESGEEVHHLNFDKQDNSPDNLVMMSKVLHAKLKAHMRANPRCPICGYCHPPH